MINCPECKTQISEKAKHCPKCGCQIRNINQMFLIVYAVIVTVLAALFFLGILGKNENPIKIDSIGGQERIAYNLAKEYVKKYLNYPRIVKFPKIKESKDHIIDLGNGRYKIESNVKYEYKKGDWFENNFICILIHKGQNKWILESIQMLEKTPDPNNNE